MKEIKKIDYKSIVILFTVIYGFLGIVAGLFFAITIIVPGIIAGEVGRAILFGLVAMIAATGVYAAMGAISALCLAFIYNVVAKKLGGVKIELTDVAIVEAKVIATEEVNETLKEDLEEETK